MSALRRHVLANSFKTSNAVVVAWPHLLVALASRNHPIALLMQQRGRRPQHQKQTFSRGWSEEFAASVPVCHLPLTNFSSLPRSFPASAAASSHADGFKPPPREELGDTDPKKWTDKDVDGKKRDPWSEQWFLPLFGVESADVVTFVTGSRGGIGAIADLCRIYGNKKRDGLLPIIALKVRS